MKDGFRVLVTDSDQQSRELLCNMLLLAGNEVMLARGREEALTRLREVPFDAVILVSRGLTRTVLNTADQIGSLRPRTAVVIASGEPVSMAAAEGYNVVYKDFFLDSAMEVLRRAVARRQVAASASDTERRQVRRMREQLPVEYHLVREDGNLQKPPGKALTLDLSPAGLMLEVDRAIVPGCRLQLDFAVGSPPYFLKALGEVRWKREGDPNAPHIVGIQLVHIDAEDRNWVANYISVHRSG
jgi:CheY-like chemotaxis protein